MEFKKPSKKERISGFQKWLKIRVSQIEEALDSEPINKKFLNKLIHKLHASEFAQLIQSLDIRYRETFITWLRPNFDPEIFFFLDDHLRAEIIKLLSDHEITQILEVMQSDDALSIFSDLDEGQKKHILKELPLDIRQSLESQLRYPEDSAGRLMQQEVLTLPQSWTIKQSLEFIAQEEELPENFYDLFVIDSHKRPVGVLSLSKLIKSKKKLQLKEVMIKDIKVISLKWTEEEVAFFFRSYDLMSAPVIDDKGKLIGMITIDDVIDVIEKKAEEDIMHMGGITTPDFYIPVLKTSFIRLKCLAITLINTLISVFVIKQFETTFEKRAALTILLPIAAAMGGNAGMQAVTVTVRALATRELSVLNMKRAILKEIAVALINGLVFAVIIGSVGFILFQDITISVALSGAVIFNMVWAGLAGAFLPIFISRLGYDPAVSAGPLLTTTTDVLGFAFFLGFAKLLIR